MQNTTYEAFVPSITPLIGKKVSDIEKEFDIKISAPNVCFTKIIDKKFKAFDTFTAKGHYLKIRKFRHKYNLF